MDMRSIKTLDITISGHKDYKDNIIKTYHTQPVTLTIKKEKEEGEKRIFVESIFGILGFLHDKDTAELLPFLEKEEEYYVDAVIKKSYLKDRIYEALVLLVNVYEKSAEFVPPEHLFNGNYVSNYGKYDFRHIMDDDYEIKCTISDADTDVMLNIDDYDDAKLFINEGVLEVYHFSLKVGTVRGAYAQKIMDYMKDEHIDLITNFLVIENPRTGIPNVRLEVTIKEKKYLDVRHYVGDKSLLIDGVTVVKKITIGNEIHSIPMSEEELKDELYTGGLANYEKKIAFRKKKEEKLGQKIEALLWVALSLVFLVIFVVKCKKEF